MNLELLAKQIATVLGAHARDLSVIVRDGEVFIDAVPASVPTSIIHMYTGPHKIEITIKLK